MAGIGGKKMIMNYVLKRTDQGGGYVSKPGSKKSYTHNLTKARKFPNIEEADGHRCIDNEIILRVDCLLDT